jgi:protein Mpv17
MAQVAALGRALLAPFASAGGWYNRTAQSAPFTTGVVTTGLKTSAADAFAQKVVEGREQMDWGRHAVFCTFGFAYLGGFQYWLYNVKFTQWCGPITARFGHRASAPIKVAIDQGLHHPLIYFPTFFSMKAAVGGRPLSSAVDKYKAEIWDSLKALWSVWVPAQLVNFAFVPRHLRIPYVAAVSFGWTVILSTMQGKFDLARQRQQEAAAAALAAAAQAVAAGAGSGAGGGGPPAPAASIVAPLAASAAAAPAAARRQGGGKEA